MWKGVRCGVIGLGVVVVTTSLLLSGCTALQNPEAPGIANTPPTAGFWVCNAKVAGAPPCTMYFNALGSCGRIVTCFWEFGDGTTESGGVETYHSYRTPGTYAVKLTVMDDRGATHSLTKTITVPMPEVGDTVDNGQIAISLRKAEIDWLTVDTYPRMYTVADLKVVALQDDQHVSKANFKLILCDGKTENHDETATQALRHCFRDAELDSGQWTEGEIAFPTFSSADFFTILEYTPPAGERIQFCFPSCWPKGPPPEDL